MEERKNMNTLLSNTLHFQNTLNTQSSSTFSSEDLMFWGFCGVFIIILVLIFTFLAIKLNGKPKSDNEILKSIENLQNTLQQSQQQTANLQNQHDEALLLKQQENLTSIQNLSDNLNQTYKNMLDGFNALNEKNASSSQLLTDMSSHINNMSNIMVNKKSRGNWGEYQLNTLLSIYAGESSEIFEVQYPLKNGYIGDVALHLPGNDKIMMIDSKFPMENYQTLTDAELSETDFAKYSSLFKQNIKKHINDINKKYITKETVDLAVMFVPSEAIYTYICAENAELIEYSHSKHVLITSPTTLLGVVFTLVNATKDFNRTKHMKDIEKSIVAMADDARRLVERLEKVQSSADTMAKSLKDARTSSEKLNNRIQKISDGYVEEK